MNLFSNTFSTLENALNYSSTRQKVITNNIANVDTPNYKAQDVSFKNVLQDSIDSIKTNRTDPRHFDLSDDSTDSNVTITQNNGSYNNNGNSVDIDNEMSNLASNQIYYDSLIELEKGKLSSLLNVVKGGQ
ncbi:flagellar basal body rod protein FlgB [Heyndrickxia ginsengihumi]|uniref:flagellar basal body rod protein FlgB n=1 Tax=Heyndrickxia ginsengihumi TaxID=363870 RepID=UPI00046E6E0D|nr:flagellar basal body rod protein FlgB [Heyndrickxia ginsengihumi]MBE6183867.1 flagellar basal body rod protein FlgB [Bacillus sp. (in: firmicutes)]MCM3022487.1 flagellar basal body rod protein FlgB [Heyndrickxia ginsengihumi]